MNGIYIVNRLVAFEVLIFSLSGGQMLLGFSTEVNVSC